MPGRVLRALCTAVIAAVVSAAPATAEPVGPSPGPPVNESANKSANEEDTAVGAQGTTVDADDAFADDDADAGPESVAGLLKQLRTLYQQAEEAGETYNGTAVELKKRTAEAKRLAAGLARARLALDRGRGEAGRLAREQYQGRSDFSAYMRLLLARDPASALDQSHIIQRMAAGRAATMERLAGAEERADQLATASRKALDKQQTLAARQKKQRDAVRARLKDIEAMLASLTTEQLAAVSLLEKKGTDAAQRELVASGALSSTRPPSRQGGDAVRYAVRQLGKPYVWGAEGPASFDCSGLTSQAWSTAGRPIPRTSQEQWRQLPKVPIRSLRPGDLVVYFPKATHVALYIGNGMVVQAPRPGTTVKVSPVASNPLLGAVRPDPGAEPLSTYTPPELPDNSTEGADTGYGADTAPVE
ncbi:C40 family peptidase [Streptomyces finlayi]|uniref:C40 family peptidase n=1 Tax=Streptomyces finlayi TaxID=67296 RepID=UPI00215622F5|nr:C40 family peptidase [Streptomyces finlayi]